MSMEWRGIRPSTMAEIMEMVDNNHPQSMGLLAGLLNNARVDIRDMFEGQGQFISENPFLKAKTVFAKAEEKGMDTRQLMEEASKWMERIWK